MQVIAANRLLYAAEPAVAEEFEMLAFSFYQKLNDIITSTKCSPFSGAFFRAREEYNFNPAGFAFDFSRQNAAMLMFSGPASRRLTLPIISSDGKGWAFTHYRLQAGSMMK